MIKSKIFSIIYIITFFIYPMILLFDWIYYLGDYVCAALAALLIIYELAYIVFLRKKEKTGLGRSIAQGFLYALVSLNIMLLINFTDNFINGFQNVTFVGQPVGERYYGFEAILNDRWSLFIFGISFTIFAVYCAGYLIISHIIKKRH